MCVEDDAVRELTYPGQDLRNHSPKSSVSSQAVEQVSLAVRRHHSASPNRKRVENERVTHSIICTPVGDPEKSHAYPDYISSVQTPQTEDHNSTQRRRLRQTQSTEWHTGHNVRREADQAIGTFNGERPCILYRPEDKRCTLFPGIHAHSPHRTPGPECLENRLYDRRHRPEPLKQALQQTRACGFVHRATFVSY